MTEPGAPFFDPATVRRCVLRGHPIYHVGRFAKVTHKRVSNLWHVLHKVTTDETWWRGYMVYRAR